MLLARADEACELALGGLEPVTGEETLFCEEVLSPSSKVPTIDVV